MKRALWSIFFVMLLVALHGCGLEQTAADGSRHVDVTIDAGSPPELAEMWSQAGTTGGFDSASARLQETILTCDKLTLRADVMIDAVTWDGRLVSLRARSDEATGDGRLRVEGCIGPSGSVQVPATGLVAPMLAALDGVGIASLIEKSNTDGTDLYALHLLQGTKDSSPGIPSSYPAFRWNGTDFVPLPADDAERTRDLSDLFLVVFPMQQLATSTGESVQSDQTTTTEAYQSLSPTYFVIPLL